MINKKQLIACALLFAALTLLIFVADALCSRLVGENEITLIEGVVGLRQVKNTGAAFSLFSSRGALIDALSGVLIAILLGVILFGRLSAACRLCLTAAMTGGMCNLYMRLFYGGVNDWIELKFVRFAVFNLADICVCLGAVGFAVFYLFKKEEK